MATVIDSLLVTLGLDSSKFKSGINDASKAQKALAAQTRSSTKEQLVLDKKRDDAQAKHAKALSEQAKSNEESLRKVRNQALKVAALFTGGLGMLAFARNTLISGANLSRMSSNLGLSAKEITGWGTAARNAGFSVEGMKQSLKDANSQIGSFKSGLGSSLIQGYMALGGKVGGGQLKNAESFKLAQASLIKQLIAKEGEPMALAQAQHWMGMSAEEFNFLKQGAAVVKAQVEQQAKLSGITQKSAEAMADLNAKLGTLKDQFEGVGVQILGALIPAFEGLLKYLQKVGDWLTEHKDAIARFSGDMSNWRDVIIAIIALKSASMFMGIAKAIGAIGAASVSSAASLGRLLPLLGAGAGGYAAGTAIYNKTANSGVMRGIGDWLGSLGYYFGGESGKEAYQLTQSGKAAMADMSKPSYSKETKALQSQAMQYFMSQGWTEAQAAGIVANLTRESGMNAGAVGDKGKAYGLGQWHPDRQAAFKRFSGSDIKGSSLAQQLAFVQYELMHGEREAGTMLRASRSATQAGAAMSWYYERPANGGAEATLRGQMAAGLVGGIPSSMVGAQSGAGAGASNSYFGKNYGAMSTSDVKIGQISIVTQANNADGIARDIAPSIHKHLSVPQANTGLN